MSTQPKPHIEPLARHANQPTKKWVTFQGEVMTTVQRTADERAQRDRERKNATEHARAARATEQESS